MVVQTHTSRSIAIAPRTLNADLHATTRRNGNVRSFSIKEGPDRYSISRSKIKAYLHRFGVAYDLGRLQGINANRLKHYIWAIDQARLASFRGESTLTLGLIRSAMSLAQEDGIPLHERAYAEIANHLVQNVYAAAQCGDVDTILKIEDNYAKLSRLAPLPALPADYLATKRTAYLLAHNRLLSDAEEHWDALSQLSLRTIRAQITRLARAGGFAPSLDWYNRIVAIVIKSRSDDLMEPPEYEAVS